ncbi:hypothetical protein niasHS_012794 [Heterodera schachtii]|uniref:Uncharacterized protein n=1 Tax=Heterodera schachtii TaxID=97005 RepID=A0ABD2IRN7_HETSC
MLFPFFLFQFYSVVYSIAPKRSPEPWGDTLKSIDDNARDFKWPDRHEKGTWAAVAATGEGSRARAETGANREEGSGMEEEEDSHIVRAEALSEREGGVAVAAANKGQTQKTSDDNNDDHDGAHQQVVVMARGDKEEEEEEEEEEVDTETAREAMKNMGEDEDLLPTINFTPAPRNIWS